jgi:hypothetical protein
MKRRQSVTMFAGCLAALGVELAALATLSACSDDGSTRGKRVVLAARVAAESLDFVNAYGYRVELTRALVSIGRLRYLQGAPVARRSPLERFLGVRVAHAHPGHYEEGGILGEMLEPTSVDLVAGPTELGSGPGVSGEALSGRVSFTSPAEGPFAADLGDAVILLEGEAALDGETRVFRAIARLSDVLDAAGEPDVEGCEFANGTIDSDGRVTLILRPSVWLDQVEFAVVPETADGAPVELARDGAPHRAFARGVKKAAAYLFTYAATAEP